MQFLPPAPVGEKEKNTFAQLFYFSYMWVSIFSWGLRLKIYFLKSISLQVWEVEFKIYSFSQYFLQASAR